MGDNGKNAALQDAIVQADAQITQGYNDYMMYRDQYDQYRQMADHAFATDVGSSGTEYMQKQMAAGRDYAGNVTASLGRQAAQNATIGSRMQGGARGLAQQSGLQAGARAANENYLGALEAGANRYAQSTADVQNRLQQSQSTSAQQQGTAANIWNSGVGNKTTAASNIQTVADQAAPWVQAGGMALMAGAMAFSDAEVKENVEHVDDYTQRLMKVVESNGK